MKMRYALASHVFACLDGDHVVLLDLKQDRYFSFEAAHAPDFDTLVAGWPVAQHASAKVIAAAPASAEVAQKLLAQGLLTPCSGIRSHSSAPIPHASTELLSDEREIAPRRGLLPVLAFVAATSAAAATLRFGSLEKAVSRVQKRRNARRGVEVLDIERARRLVSTFWYLRPFLFTARDRCLFESLALIEFLAWYGLFPSWVFGVRARPFAAHCWVQDGPLVLNDTVEHLSRYTPIMAV